MSKCKRQVYLFGLVIILLMTAASHVKANEQLGATHRQDLVIVKYGLNNHAVGFAQNQTVDTGEKINNIPLSDAGSRLIPMSGIQYMVQRIQATKTGEDISLARPATFEKVSDVQDIVTGQDGVASTSLMDGFYIVSEVANTDQHLSIPAPPILLRLPIVNQTRDGYLNTVYIYPKSSVDIVKADKVPSSHSQTILPRTGTLESEHLVRIGCITLFMAFGMLWIKLIRKVREL